MKDCFVTTNYQRPYFLKLTITALKKSGFFPILVKKPMLERYFVAEKMAKTDLYVFIDDDIIPVTQATLFEAIDLMEKHPELSQLGLGWKPNMQDEYNSSWRRGVISDDIWEFDHCGGCMIIRKGTIKDLGYKCDYKNGIGDDKVVARIARERGYKVGVAHKLWFHHLGVGNLSTVWKST